jgi:hypothetical protein
MKVRAIFSKRHSCDRLLLTRRAKRVIIAFISGLGRTLSRVRGEII